MPAETLRRTEAKAYFGERECAAEALQLRQWPDCCCCWVLLWQDMRVSVQYVRVISNVHAAGVRSTNIVPNSYASVPRAAVQHEQDCVTESRPVTACC